MLRNLISLLLIFIIFIIQTTFHATISIGGISPNLLLIFVCCSGFIRGKKHGMYMGFLSGILLDIFYGYSGVIGMNGILFMYLGYINGLLMRFSILMISVFRYCLPWQAILLIISYITVLHFCCAVIWILRIILRPSFFRK